MKIEIATVIMSHLSDAQEFMTLRLTDEANDHINFAKSLIIKYRGNILQKVDEKELNEIWKNHFRG